MTHVCVHVCVCVCVCVCVVVCVCVRLFPLKSVPVAIGSAEALEYVCRLKPPCVTWNEGLSNILGDAMGIVEVRS